MGLATMTGLLLVIITLIIMIALVLWSRHAIHVISQKKLRTLRDITHGLKK